MSRPTRKIVPPSRFNDNACVPEVSLHRRDTASMSTLSAAPKVTSSPLPESSPPPQMDMEDTWSIPTDPPQARSSLKRPSQTQSLLSVDSVIIVSPTTSDGPDGTPDTAPQAKKSKTSLTPVSREETLTSIIDIDDIEDPRDERLNKSDPTADIKAFFTAVPHVSGQPKGRMKCNLCA